MSAAAAGTPAPWWTTGPDQRTPAPSTHPMTPFIRPTTAGHQHHHHLQHAHQQPQNAMYQHQPPGHQVHHHPAAGAVPSHAIQAPHQINQIPIPYGHHVPGMIPPGGNRQRTLWTPNGNQQQQSAGAATNSQSVPNGNPSGKNWNNRSKNNKNNSNNR